MRTTARIFVVLSVVWAASCSVVRSELLPFGVLDDEQTSIVYTPDTGEVAVDGPSSYPCPIDVNIDSSSGIFTGGSIEGEPDFLSVDHISIYRDSCVAHPGWPRSFGNVAQSGLSHDFVRNDLAVLGVLAGGGGLLGPVDLVYMHDLFAGDANREFSFDQQDIVRVMQAGKYLTGEPATWGEGDWDGAPGGYPGEPPPGDGIFDQKDVVAALQAGTYLSGDYTARTPNDAKGLAEGSMTSIPEPSTLLLVAIGATGMLTIGWRRCFHRKWMLVGRTCIACAVMLGGTCIACAVMLGGTQIGFAQDGPALQAGDADQDLDFDQLDLVKIQIGGKYLSGMPATWGEGDWDGAPGGSPGNPPPGNGLFDQRDIIASLSSSSACGHGGSYASLKGNGVVGDGQTSVGYNANTGELWVDASAGVNLASINIDSVASIFTGSPAMNLGGSFDNDSDDNIFKATFGGGGFGSISFGNVAQTGLTERFVRNDLTTIGTNCNGVGLGTVDLLYEVEPLLLPGDTDQDLDFDQLDLVLVLQAAKYLTGESATWGEGDWDGAPEFGGVPGNPPPGDGVFNQLDIIAALDGYYLIGPYATVTTQLERASSDRSVEYILLPEPSAAVLFAAGLVGLLSLCRRRSCPRKWVLTGQASIACAVMFCGTHVTFAEGEFDLLPGDANQDGDFDRYDIVQVLQAGKYLTDEPATWGDGDWNGWLEGEGTLGSPSPGDGVFDEFDLTIALWDNWYVEQQSRLTLQAGDADQDGDYDQYDIVQVLQAGKYLTGKAATWGEGDWNGAPGGSVGNPPAGDGIFNQLDLIAALSSGRCYGSYNLCGPYAAVSILDVRSWSESRSMPDGSLVGGDGSGDVDLTSIPVPSATSLLILGVLCATPTRYCRSFCDHGCGENHHERPKSKTRQTAV